MKQFAKTFTFPTLGKTPRMQSLILPFGLMDRFTTASQSIVPRSAFTREVSGSGWIMQDGMMHLETWNSPEYHAFPFGDKALWYEPGVAREAGTALIVQFVPEDRASRMRIGFSRHDGPASYTELDNHWIHTNGGIYFSANETDVDFTSNFREIKPMLYIVAVILRPTGAYYLISSFVEDSGAAHGAIDPIGIPAFPNFRLLGMDRSSNAQIMYPNIQFSDGFGYPLGHTIRSVSLQKLDAAWSGLRIFEDTFNRANGSLGGQWVSDDGTWGIVNGEASLLNPNGFSRVWHPGAADGVLEVTVRVPEGPLAWFGLETRRKDAGNYIRVVNDGANAIKIQTFVNGGYNDTLFAGPYNWTPGDHTLCLYEHGNKYAMTIQGQIMTGGWIVDPQNRMIDGTGHGFYMLDNGFRVTYKNITQAPMHIALDASVIPTSIPTFTSTVTTNETFSYPNGTSLATVGWSVPNGTATVTNSKVNLQGSGQLFAVKDVGSLTYEMSLDFTLAATATDYVAAGIVVNYTDPDQWILFRPTIDKFDQPDADEIEIVWNMGGELVIRKAQMNGLVYVPNATHRLTVQCVNDTINPERAILYAFLDGKPKLTFPLPPSIPRTSWCGMYRSSMDDGTVFDNLTIRT